MTKQSQTMPTPIEPLFASWMSLVIECCCQSLSKLQLDWRAIRKRERSDWVSTMALMEETLNKPVGIECSSRVVLNASMSCCSLDSFVNILTNSEALHSNQRRSQTRQHQHFFELLFHWTDGKKKYSFHEQSAAERSLERAVVDSFFPQKIFDAKSSVESSDDCHRGVSMSTAFRPSRALTTPCRVVRSCYHCV